MTAHDDFDRALDARLRRAFAPPADLRERLRLPQSAPSVARRRPRRAVFAAAAVLLVALAAVLWSRRSPAPLAVDDLYAAAGTCVEQVAACSNEVELAARLRSDYGLELRVPAGPIGLQGPYTLPQWPQLAVLLARGESAWICVAVSKTSRRPVLAPDSALHVHESRLGDTTLWEISPLAEPRCLPVFALAATAR
jgi:hypothetical protein